MFCKWVSYLACNLAPVQTSASETQSLQFLYGFVVNLSHFSAAEVCLNALFRCLQYIGFRLFLLTNIPPL